MTFDPAFDPARFLGRARFPEPFLYPAKILARDLALAPEGWVIGVARNGEACAYPAAVMGHLHLATDIIGDEPVLVSFCKNCFSAVAFDPRHDGVLLTFKAFGGHEGSLVIRDEETGTLWSQTTGRGLAGPLAGQELRQVPVELATLGDWLARYPASTAPDPALGPPPRTVEPGKELGEGWLGTVSVTDDRLPDRTLVLGVRVGGAARAYELDPVRSVPGAYHDVVGGVPIMLWSSHGRWPLAFDRRVGGTTIEFGSDEQPEPADERSPWTAEGLALGGKHRGTTLRFVPSHVTEWYAWVANHPGTDVVTRAQMLDEA